MGIVFFKETIFFDFLKFETLRDCQSYRIYGVSYRPAQAAIAGRHLPCSCGNLDNRSL
jgi:hypothetical protein